jgi:hypothetical protein
MTRALLIVAVIVACAVAAYGLSLVWVWIVTS